MRQAIEDFLLAKKAQASSPNTIKGYRAALAQLVGFVGENQGLAVLTRTVLRAYLASLIRQKYSNASIDVKVGVLRSFLHWLHAEERISENFYLEAMSVKGPRRTIRLPDIPSVEEIALLLDGDFPTAFPQRDRLILELLYGAGLRVSEAAHLTLDDLRPEQNAILIHGKGGHYGKAAKLRVVPINPYVQKALTPYLALRAKALERRRLKPSALFFGLAGKHTESPISTRSVHRMLLHMTKVRGLQPMHPHLLRHACATHMLDNGAPLDVIQHLLGHDNIEITAHYAQVSTRLMMSAYNRAHPHAMGRK
ncbi:MAG: tyrosine-type recombinase/integrase [Candidatus Sulfotelmatobacter sp.]